MPDGKAEAESSSTGSRSQTYCVCASSGIVVAAHRVALTARPDASDCGPEKAFGAHSAESAARRRSLAPRFGEGLARGQRWGFPDARSTRPASDRDILSPNEFSGCYRSAAIDLSEAARELLHRAG